MLGHHRRVSLHASARSAAIQAQPRFLIVGEAVGIVIGLDFQRDLRGVAVSASLFVASSVMTCTARAQHHVLRFAVAQRAITIAEPR